MTQVSDEELMLYYDQELEPERAQRFERMLASDPELRERLRRLSCTGDAARNWQEEHWDRRSSADLIIARVQGVTTPKNPAGRPARFGLWFASAGAIALAATVLLVLYALPEGGTGIIAGSTRLAVVTDASVQSEAKELGTVEGPAIQVLDLGANQVAIFVVSSSEASTPVLWLTEEANAAHPGQETL